jgi:hypothetical protein
MLPINPTRKDNSKDKLAINPRSRLYYEGGGPEEVAHNWVKVASFWA